MMVTHLVADGGNDLLDLSLDLLIELSEVAGVRAEESQELRGGISEDLVALNLGSLNELLSQSLDVGDVS